MTSMVEFTDKSAVDDQFYDISSDLNAVMM